MTSVDWEEVKRLAADFQKAQLSSTLQKYETPLLHNMDQSDFVLVVISEKL